MDFSWYHQGTLLGTLLGALGGGAGRHRHPLGGGIFLVVKGMVTCNCATADAAFS